MDHNAAGRQRQGDAPGADAQLQSPAASKLRQDVGRRVRGARAEHLRPLVVGRRGTFSEVAVIIVHRRTVPQKTSAALAGFARSVACRSGHPMGLAGVPCNRGSCEGRRFPSAHSEGLRGILATWLTTPHGTGLSITR